MVSPTFNTEYNISLENNNLNPNTDEIKESIDSNK